MTFKELEPRRGKKFICMHKDVPQVFVTEIRKINLQYSAWAEPAGIREKEECGNTLINVKNNNKYLLISKIWCRRLILMRLKKWVAMKWKTWHRLWDDTKYAND